MSEKVTMDRPAYELMSVEEIAALLSRKRLTMTTLDLSCLWLPQYFRAYKAARITVPTPIKMALRNPALFTGLKSGDACVIFARQSTIDSPVIARASHQWKVYQTPGAEGILSALSAYQSAATTLAARRFLPEMDLEVLFDTTTPWPENIVFELPEVDTEAESEVIRRAKAEIDRVCDAALAEIAAEAARRSGASS